MKQPKVKLKLRKLEHECMAELLEATFLQTPVKDWALETYIISDLYVKKMAFFKLLPQVKRHEETLSLTMIQAIAINQYYGPNSTQYNILLRNKIEPFLIMPNSN